MNILQLFGVNQVVDGANKVVDQTGLEQDILNPIQVAINGFIGVIGIVAVVIIIMGAIHYSTSQGDAGKIKKAKDTILYGIIGLIVAITAFSIVNFVLGSLF